MPKNTPTRIIDERRTATGAVFGGGNSAGGVTDHGLLEGLADDDHAHYLNNARGDLRYMPITANVIAGAGLGSTGVIATGLTVNVGAGDGITVNANSIELASSVAGAGLSYTSGVLAVTPGEGLEIETDAIGLAASVAGAALAYNAGVLSVTPGEGLEIETDAIGLASSVAGAGLGYNAGVLAVGQGAGLTVSADTVALTTPGTLTVATTSSATGNHTHAITSSSDPDATASLLATTGAGLLTLRTGAFRRAAQSQVTFDTGWDGAGWQIDYDITTPGKASAEFDNLTVRGSMRVYELLIQQIRATNGSLFVSSASKVVSATGETSPLWTVNGSQLTFNGANANLATEIYQVATAAAGDTGRELYHGFLVGDIIRSQEVRWNGSTYDLVRTSNMEVTAVTDLYNYQATLFSGLSPATNADYVRLGSSSNVARRGSVYLTADDSAAPFIDIVDDIRSHEDWNTPGKIKVRVGKLTGISDVDFGGALDGYGLYGNNVFLKGRIVVTGGSLGGLAAADVNGNTTTIDGGKITANSVTAAQIAANTITAGQIAANTITAGQIAATTITAGQIAANTITAAQIAAGTITATQIAASTITADKLSVTDLSAIGATIGAWSIATNGISSTNIRLYSGDGYTARLELGDGTAARTAGVRAGLGAAADIAFWAGAAHDNTTGAPFRVTLAGSLTANDATFGDLLIGGAGAYVAAQASDNIFANGYKFTQGGSITAGMTASYVASTVAQLAIYNNYDTDGTAKYAINSTIALKNYSGGAGKTAGINLEANHETGGAASVSVSSSDTTQTVAMQGDVLTWNGGNIWHAGNLTPSNYAPLASPAFTGTPTAETFRVPNNTGSTGERYIDLGRWRDVTTNTDLSTPAANHARIHFYINSSGKGRLAVVWPDGTRQDFATEA